LNISYAASKDALIFNLAQRGGVCVGHGTRAKRCSSEGCTNVSVKGGVCKRHGAISIVNVKLYNSEGANQVQRGGVCWRHGANRITHNESTAFGSEFEKTTETQTPPNQLLLELPQEKDRKEVEFLKRLPFFVKILLNDCVVSMPRAFLAF